MPYTDQVDRTGASPLIPEDATREILAGVVNKSAALQLFTHRRMARAQQRMPVVSALPTAYWVTGDTGLKQTTNVNWTNKYLDAEELAVIVPIPEKVLDDVDYDLWDEIRPLLEEAIAVALDAAIFFGTNKPSSWPSDIKTAASAAGNAVTAGTSAIDIADDINNVMGAIEADGYDVNGFWARTNMKSVLRGLRDSQKQPIFNTPLQGVQTVKMQPELFSEKIVFSQAGLAGFATGSGNVHLIAGDWKQGIIGIRQDLTFKKLDQASLHDSGGNLVYNLPQQDMIAMRVVARYAFQVPNPINRQNTNSATRYPFGTLIQA